MAQRNSGHSRQKSELYQTPAWVITDGLVPHFPVAGLLIAEPACGPGKMVLALEACGAEVMPSDIKLHRDYPLLSRRRRRPLVRGDFARGAVDVSEADAIITNPPYGPSGALACQFIAEGINYLRRRPLSSRFVAMLLPVDFDSGSTRTNLFRDCPEFYGSIKLLRRIEWFKRLPGKGGPSVNHAWFIWRLPRFQPRPNPVTLYAPIAVE